MTTKINLKAPLSGVLVALENVPDPVFAEKMVGDGISIDPTSNVLLSPVAGTITLVHDSKHAVSITTEEGVEILMHIGLDTVMLKGEGFTSKVKLNDKVAVGQALIEFDMDLVGQKAVSLLTQIVITNGDKISQYLPKQGRVQAGKDEILSLALVGSDSEAKEITNSTRSASCIIKVANPTGLHARPAAVLANAAKKFSSSITLSCKGNTGNAKSVVSIIALGVQNNNDLTITAEGEDAEVAVQSLYDLVLSGCGEDVSGVRKVVAPVAKAHEAPKAEVAKPASDILKGVAAAPGVAIGQTFRIETQEIEVSELGEAPQVERRLFDLSLEKAHQQLEELKAKVEEADKKEIFSVQQELMEDPDLLDIAITAITNGKSAGFAWKQAYMSYAEKISSMRIKMLAERANDIHDIGKRVLRIIMDVPEVDVEVPKDVILIAEELTPSDTINIDRSRVLGICTTGGGATSHVAILARSLNIAAVCGMDEAVMSLPNGTSIILDGARGTLQKNPSPELIEKVRTLHSRLAEKQVRDMAKTFDPATTTDGKTVPIMANIANAADAKDAMKNGADGVGLLRSELLYLDREDAPQEEEQVSTYAEITKIIGKDKHCVIRTLDVGGDKPLPYLPMPAEENPFLGVRGIRLSMEEPDMLRMQIRSIIASCNETHLCIMFPMISNLEEVRMAREMFEEAKKEMNKACNVELGIMVEVPSTAVMADLFAKEVDFFSIGSNDLTQYCLAIDRGHPKLSKAADALHPAVLKMIQMTVEGAHKHGKWVGVCGGVASDPLAVPLLIGMGVDELSVSIPAIPGIKALVRELSLAQCQRMVTATANFGTAAEMRDYLGQFVDLDTMSAQNLDKL